jgi:hypothetical protein
VDLPDPHPGPGQVRIAVRAAGVSPGDWKKRKGLMDRELPQTLGHEAAGAVDELGEDVAGSGCSPSSSSSPTAPGTPSRSPISAAPMSTGVRFSSGDAGRAVHALAGIGEQIEEFSREAVTAGLHSLSG